jgi:hypothetical protein
MRRVRLRLLPLVGCLPLVLGPGPRHFPITIVAGIMAGLSTFSPANSVLFTAVPAWMGAGNGPRAEYRS